MTEPEQRQSKISQYSRSYRSDYGFEASMVAGRQRLLSELLLTERPDVVVEVGCGSDLLYQATRDVTGFVTQWVIVEPSGDFASAARAVAANDGRLVVVERFLEDAVGDVLGVSMASPKLIICSSVLHEVPDAAGFLGAVRELAAPRSALVHINVPNALSLHRRLAAAMGLIEHEQNMSRRNRTLGQYRVFDPRGLVETVERAGLRIRDFGGYLMKPFTHDQMASIPFLSQALLDGLWKLGRDLPDLAGEIYVNAELAQ